MSNALQSELFASAPSLWPSADASAAQVQISVTDAGFSVTPRGPFSLREAALFGFGQRHADGFDGVMRLAFCGDGLTAQAAVAVTQAANGTVHGEISGLVGETTPERIARQVLRVLSLDRDARGFMTLGERDPVLRKLLAVAPGLRPPLFYSPYEAALWAVLSARRPFQTAQRLRQRLSEHAGACFAVAGKRLWAAPLPARLIELGVDGIAEAAGIELQRAERVYAVASAMLDDRLDAELLCGLDPDAARSRLRELPGIGQFYADLILVRATGVTDVLPLHEPRFLALVSALYGAGDGESIVARMSKLWSPWRTWVAVLVRAAGPRLLPKSHLAW